MRSTEGRGGDWQIHNIISSSLSFEPSKNLYDNLLDPHVTRDDLGHRFSTARNMMFQPAARRRLKMDKLTTEENFQMTYAIGAIDSAIEDLFGPRDYDDALSSEDSPPPPL